MFLGLYNGSSTYEFFFYQKYNPDLQSRSLKMLRRGLRGLTGFRGQVPLLNPYKMLVHRQLSLFSKWEENINKERESLKEFIAKTQTKQQAISQQAKLYDRLHQLNEEEIIQQVKNEMQRYTAGNVAVLQEVAYSIQFLEDQENIQQILYLLYSHLNELSDTTLSFVFQNLLAYRPQKLPNIPSPRPLAGVELCFLCLAELYPSNRLLAWVQQVPIWEGQASELSVLCMALFTIYNSLTQSQQIRHQKEFDKANSTILLYLKTQDNYLLTITILVLALELFNPMAIKLLETPIIIEQLQIEQICLLVINLNRYEHVNKTKLPIVKQINNQLIDYIIGVEWQQFMKVSIFVDFYKLLEYQPEITGVWSQFFEKLASFTLKNYQEFSLSDLSSSDVVSVIASLQSKRINRKEIMFAFLLLLQDKLRKLDKADLITLTKALVTYVRQFEVFFVELRKVCEERKWEFTIDEIKELNQVFDRCRVLFKKPLFIPRVMSVQDQPKIDESDWQKVECCEVIGQIQQFSKRWKIKFLVRVAGKSQLVDFIIDTGSRETYLTEEIRNTLKIDSEQNKSLVLINGCATYIYPSTDYFKDVNLLGTEFIDQYVKEITAKPGQYKVSLKF